MITTIKIYSDSLVAVSWLRAEVEPKLFIQNRVSEIKELAKNNCFLHVEGDENVTDPITRGVSRENLQRSDCFFWPIFSVW